MFRVYILNFSGEALKSQLWHNTSNTQCHFYFGWYFPLSAAKNKTKQVSYEDIKQLYEIVSPSEQWTNNKCPSRVRIRKQSSFPPLQMSNWKLRHATDPPLKPKQVCFLGCRICLHMLIFFLPSECQQLAKERHQQETGVRLITTGWNSSNQKRRHSTCYWTKESRKALDTFISFLHGSRRISLTSLTHSERNYHSRLVPRCVQSLKWLRWWDSGVGAGDQWNVCVCACVKGACARRRRLHGCG